MKDRTSQMNRPNHPLKALNPTGGATYRVWELGREREFNGMRPFADHVGSALTDWNRRIRIRTYGGVGGRSSNLRPTRFAVGWFQRVPKLADRRRRTSRVKHSVTIRANGHKIIDRIYLILLTNLAKINNVMNMNESFTNGTVNPPKVKIANLAGCAMVSDADRSGGLIAFICVDGNPPKRSLSQS